MLGWGGKMEKKTIVWTEYMKYRLMLRGNDIAAV
jgi:hypothetical protein